jgi:predicted alternative tryptophan synthase beta-subunit
MATKYLLREDQIPRHWYHLCMHQTVIGLEAQEQMDTR